MSCGPGVLTLWDSESKLAEDEAAHDTIESEREGNDFLLI